MPRHAAKRCVRQTAGTPHSPTTSSAEAVVQPCSIAASVIIEKVSGADCASPLGCPPDNRGRTGSGIRSRRSEFSTTRTLEPAITAAASTGCRRPSAARVSAIRLYPNAHSRLVRIVIRTARATSTTHGSIHNPSRGKTKPAVSRARSVAEPTAIPISASASTGPSLRPSPTIATHLLGDAIIAGDMPKSAFSANSQAKACAFAPASLLTGSSRSTPHLFNSCYTFLAPDDAWSNAINYKPLAGTIRTAHASISKVDESSEMRRRAAREAEGWYDAFTRDVFG